MKKFPRSSQGARGLQVQGWAAHSPAGHAAQGEHAALYLPFVLLLTRI